jgi:hypothetical protein
MQFLTFASLRPAILRPAIVRQEFLRPAIRRISLFIFCPNLAVLAKRGIIEFATFFRSKWETAMPMQSEFVKNVHLNTVKSMSQHGIQPQRIVEHLKSVSCDDDDIGELMQAVKLEAYPKSKNHLKR